MTRVIVVADSGAALADLTNAVIAVPGAYIARHGSGRAPLGGLVAQLRPDLVVIGGLQVAGEALARLSEVRREAPSAKVVMLSSRPDASWLAIALRAGASAVMPGNVQPRALAQVLIDVIAGPPLTAAPARTAVRRERPPKAGGRRRPRRRARPLELSPQQRAA